MRLTANDAVDTQQNEIGTGKIPNGSQGKQRAQEHHNAQDQSDNVDRQDKRIYPAAGNQADMIQVGEPGNAVGNEPDREQQCQHQCPSPGIYHKHDTGHHAQDTRNQRQGRTKAGVSLHLNEQENVCDAHDDGCNAVGNYHAGQSQVGIGKGPDSQDDQYNAQPKLKPAKTRARSHCFSPFVRISINSSPVMVSFS